MLALVIPDSLLGSRAWLSLSNAVTMGACSLLEWRCVGAVNASVRASIAVIAASVVEISGVLDSLGKNQPCLTCVLHPFCHVTPVAPVVFLAGPIYHPVTPCGSQEPR